MNQINSVLQHKKNKGNLTLNSHLFPLLLVFLPELSGASKVAREGCAGDQPARLYGAAALVPIVESAGVPAPAPPRPHQLGPHLVQVAGPSSPFLLHMNTSD